MAIKEDHIRQSAFALNSQCVLLAFLLLSILLLGGCDQGNHGADGTTLTISLRSKTHLSSHTGAIDPGSPFAAATRIPVTIATLDDTVIARGDLVEAGMELSLNVPPDTALRMKCGVYADVDLLYEGSADIDPISAGQNRTVSLTLFPVGQITARIVTHDVPLDTTRNEVPGDGVSGGAMFSANNQVVAFTSNAGNLAENSDGGVDLFLKNLVTGDITNAHTGSDGMSGTGTVDGADMSADGRIVVFASTASNLVTDDTNGVSDIFLKDTDTGQITRLSVSGTGQQLTQASSHPVLSDDAQMVAFCSAGELLADGNTGVFLLKNPVQEGATLVYIGAGCYPRISGDGSTVLYRNTDADELYLYDVGTATSQRIGAFSGATPAAHDLNADGQYAVFVTNDGLDPIDTNGLPDVYLYHRATHAVRLISADNVGAVLAGQTAGAAAPTVSADGQYVSFSYGDTVLVKDAFGGELGSLTATGTQGTISADGQLIAYTRVSDGHLYVAPNPLLVAHAPPQMTPVPTAEQPLAQPRVMLQVAISGTGQGSIVSTGPGIDCGTDCSESYPVGTTVTLTANPDTGAIFLNWSGDCTGGEMVTDVLVDRDTTCNAVFGQKDLPVYRLSMDVSGDGSGVVTSDDLSINCPNACQTNYQGDTIVNLKAVPGPNSRFAGWTGDCNGTAPNLQVTLPPDRTCGALFQATHFTLTLNIGGGPNAGAVVSNDGPQPTLNCVNTTSAASTCAATFPRNSSIVLTATPGGNNTLTTWTGCSGTVTKNTCTITLSADTSLAVNFGSESFPLTVTKVLANGAAGTVTSDDGGINCGGKCVASYVNATVVTLRAAAATGSRFLAWGTACGGATDSTKITINKAETCAAEFIKTFALTAGSTGSGTGSVSSDVGGIKCPGVCAHDFDINATVTLSAIADAGSVFAGWNNGYCATALTMDSDKNCSATFIKQYPLIVAGTGPGAGKISSVPAGIDCPNTCSKAFNAGTPVTLTATPDSTSMFVSWNNPYCAAAFTMDSARDCSARFTVDHSKVTAPCATCHNGSAATGKPATHMATTDVCVSCHDTVLWRPARTDHTQVSVICSSCHNGTTAKGKIATHLPTTLDCGLCHQTSAWRPAIWDHTGITNNCASCHDGTLATGKPAAHIVTVNDCSVCHTTATWFGAVPAI